MSTAAAPVSTAKALIRGHLTVTLPSLVMVAVSAGVGALLFGLAGALTGAVVGACLLGWPAWAWTVRRWRRWVAANVVSRTELERAAVMTGLVGPPGSVIAQAEVTLNVPLLWAFIVGTVFFLIALDLLASGNSSPVASGIPALGCLAIAGGIAFNARRADSVLARINLVVALVATAAFLALPRVPVPVWVATGAGTFGVVFAFCLLALLIWLPQRAPDRQKFATGGVAVVLAISLAASYWAVSGPVPRLSRASSQTERTPPSKAAADWATFTTGSNMPSTTLGDGLQIIDVETGTGAAAQSGDTLVVRYIMWEADGRQLDSSDVQGGSFKFTVGTGMVIQGWDEGLPGMRVGGLRRLVIPAALAYGASGAADQSGQYVVPPNATLVFVIRLIADSSRS